MSISDDQFTFIDISIGLYMNENVTATAEEIERDSEFRKLIANHIESKIHVSESKVGSLLSKSIVIPPHVDEFEDQEFVQGILPCTDAPYWDGERETQIRSEIKDHLNRISVSGEFDVIPQPLFAACSPRDEKWDSRRCYGLLLEGRRWMALDAINGDPAKYDAIITRLGGSGSDRIRKETALLACLPISIQFSILTRFRDEVEAAYGGLLRFLS